MIRRVLRLALCAVLALVILGAISAFSSGPRAEAVTTVQTWNLVTVPCPSGQAGLGQGCYNGAGNDSANWSVHAGGATYTQPTYVASYTWSVPATVSSTDTFASGAGQIVLGTTAKDISNNSGLDTQICLTGPFSYLATRTSGYLNCANAAAPTPGSTDTESNTLLLLPGGTSPSTECPDGTFECVVEDIGLGNGHVDYTYERTTVKLRTVKYAFRGVYSTPRGSNRFFKSIAVSGRGTFEIEGTPPRVGYAKTINQSGIAALKAVERYGPTATARMRAVKVQFANGKVLHILYEVTGETHFGGCARVKTLQRFTVVKYSAPGTGGGLDFAVCGDHIGHYLKDSVQVSIRIG